MQSQSQPERSCEERYYVYTRLEKTLYNVQSRNQNIKEGRGLKFFKATSFFCHSSVTPEMELCAARFSILSLNPEHKFSGNVAVHCAFPDSLCLLIYEAWTSTVCSTTHWMTHLHFVITGVFHQYRWVGKCSVIWWWLCHFASLWAWIR